MTDEELLQLREGDRVEITAPESWQQKWVAATVEAVMGPGSCVRADRKGTFAYVTPDGFHANGRKRTALVRVGVQIRHAPHLDSTTGNVFADWLEDHGEIKAARKLRQAFPIIEKVNSSSG